MYDKKKDPETLRGMLLDDVYAGAFSGMPEMLLDEDKILDADEDELEDLANHYGIR